MTHAPAAWLRRLPLLALLLALMLALYPAVIRGEDDATPTDEQIVEEVPPTEIPYEEPPADELPLEEVPTEAPLPEELPPTEIPIEELPTEIAIEEPTPTTEPAATATEEPTATPTEEPSPSPTATATATPEPVLSLTIAQTGVHFGAVDPSGELEGAGIGVASVPEETGSLFVQTGAVEIEIVSNTGWSVDCVSVATLDAVPADEGAPQRLFWRYAGETEWSPFATEANPADVPCLTGEGDASITLDLALRVETGGESGHYQASVRFTATALLD